MESMPDITRFFHPVLAAKSLKRQPVRIELAGHAYVLFRDGEGEPAALLDRCPHRFAPLSKGRVGVDGRLACGYHGWNFDAEGHGRSPSQPALAKCDVRSFQVVERYDYLWMAARETPISALPEMEWENLEFAGSFSTVFETPVHVALANFSEDEHFPYVHTRLGWDDSHLQDISYEAENFDDRSEVRYRGPQRSSPIIRLLLVKPGDVFHNQWVTRFDPLRALFSFSWADRQTGALRPLKLKTMIYITPETASTTRFHVFLFANLEAPRLRFLMPIVKRAAVWMGWHEVQDDARFARYLADTPVEMKGMRLGKFDKPVIHNNKLLNSIYLAQPVEETEEWETRAEKALAQTLD